MAASNQLIIAVLGAVMLTMVLGITYTVLTGAAQGTSLSSNQEDFEKLRDDINGVCTGEVPRQGGSVTVTESATIEIQETSIVLKDSENQALTESSLECDAGEMEISRRLRYSITKEGDGVIIK